MRQVRTLRFRRRPVTRPAPASLSIMSAGFFQHRKNGELVRLHLDGLVAQVAHPSHFFPSRHGAGRYREVVVIAHRDRREVMIEAVSARLHVTTDRITGLTHGIALSADTAAVEQAVDALLPLVDTWLAEAEQRGRESAAVAVQRVYDLQCPTMPPDKYVDRGAWMAHRWWQTVLGHTLRDLKGSS